MSWRGRELQVTGAAGSFSGYPILYFLLPDLRGRFPRGVDGATGNDPDANARTASNTGGNTRDLVGSVQGDELGSHQHNVEYSTYATGNSGINFASIADLGGGCCTVFTTPQGGNETRPKNANVNHIIKL